MNGKRVMALARKTRIINIDIDTIITGPLDNLFDRGEDFVILQKINTTNPNPYNGSLWMVKARTRHDAWADFNVDRWKALPRHAKLSDQDWLRFKFPNLARLVQIRVYTDSKKGLDSADVNLMPDAKIVTFPGRDPGWYTDVGWVKKHWLGEQC